jgi:uncharacterized membrane protein
LHIRCAYIHHAIKQGNIGKNRLEAFGDGVITITIMVLELKVPHGTNFRGLLPLWPVFMSYVLSFVYIGIIGISSSMDITHQKSRVTDLATSSTRPAIATKLGLR